MVLALFLNYERIILFYDLIDVRSFAAMDGTSTMCCGGLCRTITRFLA